MESQRWRSVLSEALQKLVDDEFDGSGSAMARTVSADQTSISRYLREEIKSLEPYERVVNELREQGYAIDAYIDAVQRGDADDVQAVNSDSGARSGGDHPSRTIRLYTEVVAGAGTGRAALDEWAHVDVAFPDAFLRTVISSPIPEDIRVIRADGESMYPEIRDGDWVLFTPCDRVVDGSVYLIRMDDEVLIKIIQRKAGRRLRIHSLNPTFTDDIIQKTDADGWMTKDGRHVDFGVIGRYLHVIRPRDLFAASQRVADAARVAREMQQSETPSLSS